MSTDSGIPVTATPSTVAFSDRLSAYFAEEARRPESWAALSMRQTDNGHRLLTLISDRNGVITNHSRAIEGHPRTTAEDKILWADALGMAHDVLGSLEGLPLYLTGRSAKMFIDQVNEAIPGLTLRLLSGPYFKDVIKPVWSSMITSWVFDPSTSQRSLAGKMYRQSKHNTTSSQARSFLLNPSLRDAQESRYRQLVHARRLVSVNQQARPSSVREVLGSHSSIPVADSRTIHLHTDASRNVGFADQVGYGLGLCLQDGDRPVEFYSCYEPSKRGYHSHEFEFSGAMRALAAISRAYDVSEGAMLTIHLHCDNDWTVQQIKALNKLTDNPEKLQQELKSALPEERELASSAWMKNPHIQVRASWVKGHVGNTLNEACDQLAKSARYCQEKIRSGADHSRLLTQIRTELGNFREITPSFTVPPANEPQVKTEPRATVIAYTPEPIVADAEVAQEDLQHAPVLVAPEPAPCCIMEVLSSSGAPVLVRSELDLEIALRVSGSNTDPGYGMGVAVRRGQQAFRLYSSFEQVGGKLNSATLNSSGMMSALEAVLAVTQVTESGHLNIVIRNDLTDVVTQFNKLVDMEPFGRMAAFQKFLGRNVNRLPSWFNDSRITVRAEHSDKSMKHKLSDLAREARKAEAVRINLQQQWRNLEEINSATDRHEGAVALISA